MSTITAAANHAVLTSQLGDASTDEHPRLRQKSATANKAAKPSLRGALGVVSIMNAWWGLAPSALLIIVNKKRIYYGRLLGLSDRIFPSRS